MSDPSSLSHIVPCLLYQFLEQSGLNFEAKLMHKGSSHTLQRKVGEFIFLESVNQRKTYLSKKQRKTNYVMMSRYHVTSS